MLICKWTVRPGVGNTLWAFTPCERGFNYLSKVKDIEDVKPAYDNRICPICGNVIECIIDTENFYDLKKGKN